MKMRTHSILLAAVTCFGIWGCGNSDSSTTTTTDPTGIPAGYETLCAKDGMTCQTGNSPLDLVGTYTGTGTVVVTSNSIWAVGNSSTFTAVVKTQNAGTGTGTFDLGGYHLDIPQANIQGDSTQFTIYGTQSAQENDPDSGIPTNCSVEVRVVVTGTQTTSGTTKTVAGTATLEFTSNIHGSGCTQDQINNYPGTGATFSFTATRT
jgi:hypothetical protein